jgi:hypothetical protein
LCHDICVLIKDDESRRAASWLSTQIGSLREARELVTTDEAFLDMHKDQTCLVPESNEVMKDSYLLLDEEMRYVVLILVPIKD